MSGFRIKLRWLMVAVAVISLPLAAMAQVIARKHRFEAQVSFHAFESDLYIDDAGGPEFVCGTAVQGMSDAQFDAWYDNLFKRRGEEEFRCYKMAVRHGKLAEKYRQAALRPWLPVESDPPGVEAHSENRRSQFARQRAESEAQWAALMSKNEE